MTDSMTVFDRQVVRRHRDRAAPGLDGFDFLFSESAERLVDRLDDITRRFPLTLDLGCHGGEVARVLGNRGGVETLLQCDLSLAMATRASGAKARMSTATFCADEEWLPLRPGSLDMVLSNLSLHWVNDLPGALTQIRRALMPDGLFLACMFGAQTLHELRDCLAETEIEREGGLSPRTSPFADVRDAGNLLTRAGFALPTVDSEPITVMYSSPLKLLADLRGMGETNAVLERRKGLTRRETLTRALALYQERFGDAEGRVPATFNIVTMTAWAPDASQPQPAPRGSGQVNLTQVFGGDGPELS
ncbi:MAG: methyltransferase domain-containing protein [Rhodospirillum sp.]|nr:methyltransferase domain-containing protein [Rhodospirillum sp.]MCF8488272.1 methyltransferase domain-containing protein [Rhodospirillum sp.]MCF8500072.1 methyltransferase domain-containing protein [Rhodospirillum sp.]